MIKPRIRTIIPDAIEFIPTVGFGYQPQWFLSGFDTDKKARRSFALSRIVFPEGDAKISFGISEA